MALLRVRESWDERFASAAFEDGESHVTKVVSNLKAQNKPWTIVRTKSGTSVIHPQITAFFQQPWERGRGPWAPGRNSAPLTFWFHLLRHWAENPGTHHAQTSGLPNCEQINWHYLSHWVCKTLLYNFKMYPVFFPLKNYNYFPQMAE